MQLWGGNAAKSTYHLCLRDVTRLLQELLTDAPTKSKIPLCQAVSRCPSQKQKDRKHMLSPSVSQWIGGADAISTMKAEVQRPAKRRNNIKISTFPRSDKHLGAKLLPCCVRRKQRRAECAPLLSVEQMAPHNSYGPQPGGMGRALPRGSIQAWLQLAEFGVSVPLETLPCFNIFLKFSFWFKIKIVFSKCTGQETTCKNQVTPTVWSEGTA